MFFHNRTFDFPGNQETFIFPIGVMITLEWGIVLVNAPHGLSAESTRVPFRLITINVA